MGSDQTVCVHVYCDKNYIRLGRTAREFIVRNTTRFNSFDTGFGNHSAALLGVLWGQSTPGRAADLDYIYNIFFYFLYDKVHESVSSFDTSDHVALSFSCNQH